MAFAKPISLALQERRVLTTGHLLQKLISFREESIGTHVYDAYNNTQRNPEKKQERATSDIQTASVTDVEYYKDCCGKRPSLKEIEELKEYSPEKAREEFFCTILQRNADCTESKTGQAGTSLKADFKDLKQAPQREALILKALVEHTKHLPQKPLSLLFYHSSELTNNLLNCFYMQIWKI